MVHKTKNMCIEASRSPYSRALAVGGGNNDVDVIEMRVGRYLLDSRNNNRVYIQELRLLQINVDVRVGSRRRRWQLPR